MKLYMYKDKKAKFRWKLVGRNGKIVCVSSHGFRDKRGCVRNWDLVRHFGYKKVIK